LARLIRTEKEVEGRYEEIWTVVEEDALEQWPAGPLEVVGRPAPRQDGLARARGEARYTADISLPGMLHTAVLRSPLGERPLTLDLSRALELPSVHAALSYEDAEFLKEEAGYPGAAIAAVAADSFEQACAAVEAIAVEWEPLEPLLDPDEAVARGQLLSEPRHYERGDLQEALASADVVIEAEYRTQSVLHNAMETHQAVCQWEGETLVVYISTQYVWGVRNEIAGQFDLSPDRVRVVCEYMGGGFGAKNGAGDYSLIAAELARRTGRPVRCALTRREENLAAG
jgi:xanthine dehydrogenase YagR molybdenum-binding subunit